MIKKKTHQSDDSNSSIIDAKISHKHVDITLKVCLKAMVMQNYPHASRGYFSVITYTIDEYVGPTD